MVEKIKGNINIKKYDYIMAIIFFIILLVSPMNGIAKTIVLSVGFFIGLILVGMFIKDIKEKLIFLLSFTLPFNVVMYIEKDVEVINLAGAKNFFVFTFFDLLIIFMLGYYIYSEKSIINIKKNIKRIILPIIYLIVNLLSVVVAFNKVAAGYEVLRLAKCIILFVMIAFYFSEKLYVIFVKGICFGICLQLLIGLMQIIKGAPLGIQFLGESHTVFRNSVEGLEKGMSGTMAHPGTLAIYGVFCLSIIIFINKDLIKGKNIFIGATILTIILTFSRTSMLLMGIVLVSALINSFMNSSLFNYSAIINKIKCFKLTRKKIVIISMLVFVVASGLFLLRNQVGAVVDRFTNSDMSLQLKSRTWHTRIGLKAYKERENFAYGANNYTYIIRDKYPEKYASGSFHYVQPVHNLYILYLVEIGVIGVLIYIIIYGKVILSIFKINKFKSPILRSIILSTSVWALVIMIYNFTGWSGAKDYFVQIMWIVVGLNTFAVLSNKGEIA